MTRPYFTFTGYDISYLIQCSMWEAIANIHVWIYDDSLCRTRSTWAIELFLSTCFVLESCKCSEETYSVWQKAAIILKIPIPNLTMLPDKIVIFSQPTTLYFFRKYDDIGKSWFFSLSLLMICNMVCSYNCVVHTFKYQKF